jgi:hypothetical protein
MVECEGAAEGDMSMVTRIAWFWVTASAAAALLGACGPAATTPTGATATPVSLPAGVGATTTFTDPTQNAFTVAAPQGWTTNGGLQQGSPWITSASPDGATTIAIGDPSIPSFMTPSAAHPQGSSWQGVGGATVYAAPYESGVQFAQDYASRTFGQACAPLQPTGTAAEPGFAQLAQANAARMSAEVGVPPPPTQFDGGSATFSCQANGVAEAVGVIDVTAVGQGAGGAALWSVRTLIVYRTPAASQAQTDQLARAMRASYQPNPQWQAQMAATTRQALAAQQQQGAAFQQVMNQQQAAGAAALQTQAVADQNALNAQHQATMDQLDTQGVDETAAYNQQQYDQQTGQEAEMRYINNQQCVQWADAAHTRCAVTAPN